MKRKILIVSVLAIFLCGCVAGIGSDTIELPSVGQELIDLKKARDQGAINDEEYVELKQKIMEMKK
ncbi:SHOCT domain-containing protein [Desulfococcaceae bacterium HSG9]|nr:SHOCT domain-containing protein [Desulfococcaceae bacterium HSG9]